MPSTASSKWQAMAAVRAATARGSASCGMADHHCSAPMAATAANPTSIASRRARDGATSSSRNSSQASVRSNSKASVASDQRCPSSTSSTVPVAHTPVARQAASRLRACWRARQLLIRSRDSAKNASDARP